MPRKKSNALDQSGANAAVLYYPIPDYLRQLQNTNARKHSSKDVWYVYDVRKHLPIQFHPTYIIRRSNGYILVIDYLTKEIVFRATQLGKAFKYADDHLPKR